MGHSRISRLSVPLIAVSLTLLGAPALAAPAEPDLVCTAAAIARASAGLTAAESAEVELTMDATTAACTDTRPDVTDDERIVGAAITMPEAGSAEGTCGEVSAEFGLAFTWLLADGSAEQKSTLSASIKLKDGQPSGKIELSDGPVDGRALAIQLTNRAEVMRHLKAACATDAGATVIAAQVSLGFLK
ncbi:hypothetical protein [Crossiella cryophila]|uniref:Uncharacterized protein n=1 Tax=Crossiella cryophila TaxID=43355 RepID=A0A7W7FUV5_9PSEU|nr:hypothetical protein [Crossiella cryophila]MBB4678410.1 hypothetical protein [Crossiella cryophila]